MIEAGSFRDPTSRVFVQDGRILRGLTPEATEVDQAARDNGLFDALVARGLFVDSWVATDVEAPEGVPDATIIESAPVSIVSYPAEWSFAMLRDAALATLDANLLALEKGFILKDASAFNVLFAGADPRIVDIGSLERFGERGIWTAYGQFCEHFLAPLMLEAYTGVPFQQVLRGAIDGIPIGDLNGFLRGRSGIHRGVLSHVRLRNLLERRAAGMGTEARRSVGSVSLPASAVAATIRKMHKLVSQLESAASSTWADYESALPYATASTEAKASFVRMSADRAESKNLAVDVGANAGMFTTILDEHFDHVVGIDNDPGAIDALYRANRGRASLTPMVIDITNPTSAFGWRGRERRAFTERVQPDLATWLAVLHHLCLGIGLPLDEVTELITEFSDEAVVEFVAIDDPMAQRISASRTTALAPYDQAHFEQYVTRTAKIVASDQVSDTRTLYHLRRS